MKEKYRLLIVDDELYNLKVLNELLKYDYTIMAVKNAKSALKALESGLKPHLIILDIMMPEMDGYDLLKELKKNPETENIPVIFVTAVSEKKDDSKGFELGAVDYITKPFHPLAVKARVKTHLKLSTALSELKEALLKVKTLTGLLPICMHCKKIRDDKGYWTQIENYLKDHSEAEFSHSICSDCLDKYYPEISDPHDGDDSKKNKD